MKWYEAVGIGMAMACLYALTLWASIDALSQLSFLEHRDPYYMPFRVTAVIMFIAFLCLFLVPVWYTFAEKWVWEAGERIGSDLEKGRKKAERERRKRTNQPFYKAVSVLEQIGKGEE